MTEEEAKQLKVGDRIKSKNSNYPVWEVDEVVERGVVIYITGYQYKSHKGLCEWPQLKGFVKL